MENKTCGGSMNVHAWKGYPTDLNDGKLHFKISLYLSGRTSRNKLLFLLTLPWCRYLQYHLTPGKCPLKWWNSLVIQLLPLLHEKLVSSSIRKYSIKLFRRPHRLKSDAAEEIPTIGLGCGWRRPPHSMPLLSPLRWRRIWLPAPLKKVLWKYH